MNRWTPKKYMDVHFRCLNGERHASIAKSHGVGVERIRQIAARCRRREKRLLEELLVEVEKLQRWWIAGEWSKTAPVPQSPAPASDQ